MRVLITDTFARNYKPTKDREDIFGAQVPKLRLRISKKSGVRSWDYRFPSPTTRKLVSMKIGSLKGTTIAGARERALAALAHVEAGRDPREPFAAEDEAGLIVAQLIDKYLKLRPNEHEHGMTSAPKLRQNMNKHVVPKIGGVRVSPFVQ